MNIDSGRKPISQQGQNVPLGMMGDAAKFLCGGVLNKHVLQQLEREPTKTLEHFRH